MVASLPDGTCGGLLALRPFSLPTHPMRWKSHSPSGLVSSYGPLTSLLGVLGGRHGTLPRRSCSTPLRRAEWNGWCRLVATRVARRTGQCILRMLANPLTPSAVAHWRFTGDRRASDFVSLCLLTSRLYAYVATQRLAYNSAVPKIRFSEPCFAPLGATCPGAARAQDRGPFWGGYLLLPFQKFDGFPHIVPNDFFLQPKS